MSLISFDEEYLAISCVDDATQDVHLRLRGDSNLRIAACTILDRTTAVFRISDLVKKFGIYDVEIVRRDGSRSKFGKEIGRLIHHDRNRKVAVSSFSVGRPKDVHLCAYFTFSRSSLSVAVFDDESRIDRIVFGLHAAKLDYISLESNILSIRGHFLLAGVDSSSCEVALVLTAAGIDSELSETCILHQRADLQDKYGAGTNHNYLMSGFSAEVDLNRLADQHLINGRRIKMSIRVSYNGDHYVRQVTKMPPAFGSLSGKIKEFVDVHLEHNEVSNSLYIAYSRKFEVSFAQATKVKRASADSVVLTGAVSVYGIPAAALSVELIAIQRNEGGELAVPTRSWPSRWVTEQLCGSHEDGLAFEVKLDVAQIATGLLSSDRHIDFHVQIRVMGIVVRRRLTVGLAHFSSAIGEDLLTFPSLVSGSEVLLTLTRNGAVSLAIRERLPEDGVWFRIKEHAALALNYLLPKPRRPIWITYETYSSTAQDNSFYFFKWLVKNVPGQPIFYVIRKGSADVDRLTEFGNKVVYYYSLKHLLLMLRCSLFVAAQGRFHAFKFRPRRSRFKKAVMAKPLVFLQHGVTAFKKSAFKKGDPSGSADLIIAVSEQEKALIIKHWGYKPEEVIVAGFSRFDVLQDKSSVDEPTVLVMPTWRSWLEDVSQESFDASEFCASYLQLLSHLDAKGIKSNFYIHIKLEKYVRSWADKFKYVNIVLLGEEPVNEMLMEASVLVTDYSSVAWDFHYMQKPTVFFQFDRERYERVTGSFVDLRKNTFGTRSEQVAEAVGLVEQALFTHPRELSPAQFKFVDQNNSLRIYRAIVRKFGINYH